MRPESGFQIAPNHITIYRYDAIVKFFWRLLISFVKFSYWSKFHVNNITGFEVVAIFFYKGLTRGPKIENNPVWVLPNIWRVGKVRDTKFGTKVSNEMLLNAAKYQGYSFYSFWVIKWKPTGGKITPHPPRLRLNLFQSEESI